MAFWMMIRLFLESLRTNLSMYKRSASTLSSVILLCIITEMDFRLMYNIDILTVGSLQTKTYTALTTRLRT